MAQPPQRLSPCDATQKVATDPAHLTGQSPTHSRRQPTSVRRSWPSPHQTMTGNCAPDCSTSRTGLAVRTSKLLLSDIGLFTGVSLDKSPGDSLLFKQSALRGVSYALTIHVDADEEIDGAVAAVLAIVTLELTRLGRDRLAHFADQLNRALVDLPAAGDLALRHRGRAR